MIYDFEVEVAAGVEQAEATETILQLHPGVIYRVELVFYLGSYGLLHCFIADRLMHLWPRNADSYFTSSAWSPSFEEEYEMVDPPYELSAYSWSDDEVFSHKYMIRVGIRRPELKVVKPVGFEEIVELFLPQLGVGS